MEKLGYGPDKRLAIKVSTRNIPAWRDPAVILISQLKEIYIDAELELVDTAALVSEDDAQGLHGRRGADRERRRRSRTRCSTRITTTGAARNYAGYSDPEIDKLIDQQSMEADPEKRKEIVWQIERRLAEAAFRPVHLLPGRRGLLAALGQGLTMMTNSIYNGWRMEDVWLDK